jgi:hypothetical protein
MLRRIWSMAVELKVLTEVLSMHDLVGRGFSASMMSKSKGA